MESERSAPEPRSEEHRSFCSKSGAISEMIPGGDGGDFALDEQRAGSGDPGPRPGDVSIGDFRNDPGQRWRGFCAGSGGELDPRTEDPDLRILRSATGVQRLDTLK